MNAPISKKCIFIENMNEIEPRRPIKFNLSFLKKNNLQIVLYIYKNYSKLTLTF